MNASLAERFDLGDHELVAFVGAGGKSTLLLHLGAELDHAGSRVILTTTTKLGLDQVTGTVCRSSDPVEVEACFASPGPVFVVSTEDGRKVTGPSLADVDRLFAESTADYILVEADGARGRLIKAPDVHEPVVPTTATLVVVVASLNAIGLPLAEAAHRPELVSALSGLNLTAPVGPEHVAALLAHPEGGLKGVPDQARVVVALTGGKPEGREEAAGLIRRRLARVPRISEVTLIPSFN